MINGRYPYCYYYYEYYYNSRESSKYIIWHFELQRNCPSAEHARGLRACVGRQNNQARCSETNIKV
eukprot:scaffold546075_cov29-Prasinocladus_malaysianus.AAC.1